MVRKDYFHQTKQYRKFVIGAILPIVLILLLVQFVSAQNLVTAAQLEVTKSVDSENVQQGESIQYTIEMENVGDTTAFPVIMTDTVPSDLTVVTATVQGGYDSWGIDGNVITWTGSIAGNNGAVNITIDAVVTDTAAFEPITNTVYVTGTGALLSDWATFTVTEIITHYVYFPVIAKPAPIPELLSVSAPSTSNGYDTFQFIATWSDEGSDGRYELQESRTADFANSTEYNAGTATSKAVGHGISRDYEFYYRVRFITDNGLTSSWSNVIKQYGPYHDSFNDENRDWIIRREDTDDVDNESYYQDGTFVLKLHGRWDFAIGGPMVKVPWDSYRVETRIRFDPGVDNLHSYGLIWGGDWNGISACPNEGFTSCLNHYYRLNILWYGSENNLRTQVKRIDYHDSDNGAGRGSSLAGYGDVGVNSPAGGWQNWAIEHSLDGEIKMFANGNQVRDGGIRGDATYTGAGTYFGVLATSNEYSGTEPWVDWVRVTPLP